MTIERIKYEELLPSGKYLNIRYGIEISCTDEEVEKAFSLARQIVQETHQKNFPEFYDQKKFVYEGEQEQLPVVNKTSPAAAKAQMIAEILLVNTLELPNGLESYKVLAESDKDIKAAYYLRLKQLTANGFQQNKV